MVKKKKSKKKKVKYPKPISVLGLLDYNFTTIHAMEIYNHIRIQVNANEVARIGAEDARSLSKWLKQAADWLEQ